MWKHKEKNNSKSSLKWAGRVLILFKQLLEQRKNPSIPFFSSADPRSWTPEHVLIWLNWAKREFSLEINNVEELTKKYGRDIVALGREGFLAIAPPFTGDILWEHLEILQKGKKH